MQAPKVVKVPLSRIKAGEASIILVIRVKSQLELLADVDAFVTEDRLEPPVRLLVCISIVSDAGSNLIRLLGAMISWPSVEGARLTPVGPDRVSDTLSASARSPRECAIAYESSPNTSDQRLYQPRCQAAAVQT